MTSQAQPEMNHRTEEPDNTSAKNIDREPASRIKTSFAASGTFVAAASCPDIDYYWFRPVEKDDGGAATSEKRSLGGYDLLSRSDRG